MEDRLMRRLQLVGLSLLVSFVVGAVGLHAQDGQRNITRQRNSGQKWALLIGVDDYAYVNKLESCGQDMRALRERLLASGFPERQVYLLHDKADANKYRPFKASIEAQLDLLLGKVDDKGQAISPGLVDNDDLVVVAFSGHGVLLDGASYLCPVETKLDKAETLVSLDGIYNRLSACRAGQKLLVVDACRSDPRLGGQKAPGAPNPAQGFAKTLEKPPEGILVLASCAAKQVSWEDPKQLGHGVFMHFVLKGLAGEAQDKDGEVTMLGLYKYAFKETKLYVANTFGETQTPELFGKVQGDFAVGPVGGIASAPSFTNSLKMKLVRIPAGKFWMGSFKGEEGAYDDERPRHEVEISQPFYMGTTAVTVGQFTEFVRDANYTTEAEKDGKGGYRFNLATGKWEQKPEYTWRNADWQQSDEHPVVNVSWNDAVAFCEWLSKKENREYRLPTEAEREYACRAGTKTRYWSGDSEDSLNGVANIADASLKAKANAELAKSWTLATWNDGYPFTSPVGKLKANPWGLYDMHGNVWEWCKDIYGTYKDGYQKDPQGELTGHRRVQRGGSWCFVPRYARAAGRLNGFAPGPRASDVGFRVVAVATRTP
jgi:formylglycine-generating enzyme required for sulfatase activity